MTVHEMTESRKLYRWLKRHGLLGFDALSPVWRIGWDGDKLVGHRTTLAVLYRGRLAEILR